MTGHCMWRVRALVAAALVTTLAAAGTAWAGPEGVEIHGFLSQGFLKSTDNNYLGRSSQGSFDFTEMGLNFSTNLDEKLRIGVQLFSRNQGELGRFKVDLDWAFADYHWRDQLGLRVGRMKLPYGFYNEIADIDSLRTTVLLPRGVYDVRYRDMFVALTGVGAYGTLGFGKGGTLEYQLQDGTVPIPTDGSIARYFNDKGAFTVTHFDVDRVTAGSLVYNTPLSGLRFGGTLIRAKWRAEGETTPQVLGLEQLLHIAPTPVIRFGSNNLQFSVVSAQYTQGPLQLTYETSRWKSTMNFDFPPALGLVSPGFAGTQFMKQEAWYGQASYRLGRHFELAATRSEHYANQDDESGRSYNPPSDAYQKEWVLSGRFDITDNWVFKLEGHDIDGTSGLSRVDNGGVVLAGYADPVAPRWKLWAAKLSYIF